MTKQEQIEEMRKEIENGFRKADCRQPYTNEPYPYFETQKTAIAKALYDAGYRKVPDGAIVLTPEERDDEMKELSEFKTPPCEKSEKACGNCKWLIKINTPDVYECECYVEDGRPITRPPQSYMYIEDL